MAEGRLKSLIWRLYKKKSLTNSWTNLNWSTKRIYEGPPPSVWSTQVIGPRLTLVCLMYILSPSWTSSRIECISWLTMNKEKEEQIWHSIFCLGCVFSFAWFEGFENCFDLREMPWVCRVPSIWTQVAQNTRAMDTREKHGGWWTHGRNTHMHAHG